MKSRKNSYSKFHRLIGRGSSGDENIINRQNKNWLRQKKKNQWLINIKKNWLRKKISAWVKIYSYIFRICQRKIATVQITP